MFWPEDDGLRVCLCACVYVCALYYINGESQVSLLGNGVARDLIWAEQKKERSTTEKNEKRKKKREKE